MAAIRVSKVNREVAVTPTSVLRVSKVNREVAVGLSPLLKVSKVAREVAVLDVASSTRREPAVIWFE